MAMQQFPPADALTVTPAALLDIMRVCYDAKLPLLVWGQPGIGKSDISRQFAAAIRGAHYDTRLGQFSDVDLRGVPEVEGPASERHTAWRPPSEFPYDDVVAVWNVDELNRCQISTQNAALQLLLDRRLGSYRVPPAVWIMACANPDGSRGTVPLSDAVCGRFTHVYLVPSAQDWEAWAYGAQLDPRVIAYLHLAPAALHEPDTAGHAKPQPRTWEFVSRALAANPPAAAELAIISGQVGHGRAIEFCAFLDLWRARKTYSIDQCISDPTGAPVPGPEAHGTRYSIAAGVSARMDETNVGQALTYLARMPREYAEFALQLALRREQQVSRDAGQDPPISPLTHTRAYVNWCASRQRA